VIAGVPDLAYLTPDPSDPNLSTCDVTVFDSQQPEPGGFDNVKQTVSWEIRRHRLP
jgi:hypothetical protein